VINQGTRDQLAVTSVLICRNGKMTALTIFFKPIYVHFYDK